ncbi:MAG: NFACT family protein [Clostridiales bacterium]|nr:NFACT family protein [Clostridiales bacterium]
MAVDGITLQLLSDELNESLSGCRIDKVFQPDRHTLVFHMRGYSGIKKLLISILPSEPHINVTESTRDNPQMPPSFCMLLRKYISGSRIISITNPGYERLIEFTLTNTDELHDSKTYRLIIELMGRFSNVILVNENGKIIDSAIHIDFDISRVREVMPARIYDYPQSQDKMTPIQCLEAIAKGSLPILQDEMSRPVAKALLASVRGISPTQARILCIRSGIDERYVINDLDDKHISSLMAICKEFFTSICSRDYKAYLYLDDNNDVCEFSTLKYSGYPHVREFDSISDCLEEYYSLKEKNINFDLRQHRLTQITSNALSKVMRKYEIHLSDLEDARNSDRYKLYGDLILSYGYLIRPKADSVTCSNYYSDPPQDITIPLDPSLNANANAQNYYRQFRKAKRKMEVAQEYIKEDELAIKYLRSVKTAIEACSDIDDIKACEEEISSEILSESVHKKEKKTNSGDPNKMVGIAKSGKASSRALRNAARIAEAKRKGSSRSKDKHRSEEALPFRHFYTSDGYEIYCGRNNIQNDRLTFSVADNDDWWFHIKDLPGTHVILKAHKGEEFPSDAAVLEAAQAAAYYSRTTVLEEHTDRIEIDYCPVSHVKKIPHSKPGMVIYDQYYSIVVDPVKPRNS